MTLKLSCFLNTQFSVLGEDWETMKSKIQSSQGVRVDLSTPGVTKLIANSAPSNLKMIPIAFRNIVGKDAELIEVTGTNYKTSANAGSAGLFALPVTPMGRIQPVKLNAKVRNGSAKLLMNGEEEYSVDVNSAYVVIIIHTPGRDIVNIIKFYILPLYNVFLPYFPKYNFDI